MPPPPPPLALLFLLLALGARNIVCGFGGVVGDCTRKKYASKYLRDCLRQLYECVAFSRQHTDYSRRHPRDRGQKPGAQVKPNAHVEQVQQAAPHSRHTGPRAPCIQQEPQTTTDHRPHTRECAA